MGEKRKFHAGTILSVLTPYLVSPGGVTDVDELLAFMAPEDHTHIDPKAEALARFGVPFRSAFGSRPS